MKTFSLTLCTFVLSLAVAQEDNRVCREDKEILEIILKNYSVSSPPNKLPVKTTNEYWIQDIYNVDTEKKQMEMDIFVSYHWLDDRLDFKGYTPCHDNITIQDDYEDKIWQPHMNFINVKSSQVLSAPMRSVFILIYSDGKVWVNYRMRISAPCQLEDNRYPFDKVTCKVILESYRYNIQVVDADWKGEMPIMVLGSPSLTDFVLVNHTHEREVESYPAGRWTELTFKMVFQRKYGTAFVRMFIPAILAVIAAGITFFLGKKSAIARTIMATLALFFLIYLLRDVTGGLSGAHTLKMIDVYILVCIVFVLSALIEVALANGCSNTGASYQIGDTRSNGFEALPGGAKDSSYRRPRFCRRHCGKFDLSAGVLYFLLFAAWNVVYFLVLAVM